MGSAEKHRQKSVVRLRKSLAAGIALTATTAAGLLIISTGIFSADHGGAQAMREQAGFAYQAPDRAARSATHRATREPLPTASPTPTKKTAKTAKPSATKPAGDRSRRSSASTGAYKIVGGGSCEASYYDEGQMTASGEPFDPSEMTAAHKRLAFGTKVRVINKNNGESAIVRINDRGPYISGRCLDLSRAAMKAVGGMGSGVIPVRYQILARS
ncbi:MAG TPA: septal ring lytic transglycosylase RlpA family protein [Streptosporangiaceae bacterium]|nr:septal ring lytic transglycosylase RlpA family protein [Streptosporangiaceae bacterium]